MESVQVIKSQDSVDPGWRYTQNWIAYEIGLACQKGIDVWAVCDSVPINFPLPYINNYFIHGLNNEDAFKAFKTILEFYREGSNFPAGWQDNKYFVKCPNIDCKMEFNLMGGLQPKSIIKCPQCLKDMEFPDGFNYITSNIDDW